MTRYYSSGDANGAHPRKIPGWIVVVRENFFFSKRASRNHKIEIVLSGFLAVFFFKFYIWLSFRIRKAELASERKCSGER